MSKEYIRLNGKICSDIKKPKMIIFDYGHTLLYEPGFDAVRCEEAAYPYIVENPQNLTAEQIYAEVQKLFVKFKKHRDNGIEVHEWQFMRLILTIYIFTTGMSWLYFCRR